MASPYPIPLREAATRLANNEDFRTVMSSYRAVLEDAVLTASDDKDLLASKAAYDAFIDFGSHVSMLQVKEHHNG